MKIYFLNGNTPEIEYHYRDKEYRDDVIVEIDSLFYEIYFFTKDSLEYEMTTDGFFSLVGLVILEDISTSKIITAIKELYKKGFFSRFHGTISLNRQKRFCHDWYIRYNDYDNPTDYCILDVE